MIKKEKSTQVVDKENKKLQKKIHKYDHFFLIFIILSAILIGFETDHKLYLDNITLFHTIDIFIIIVFTLEIIFKVYISRNKLSVYFKDPWNIFDLVILVLCILPYLISSGREDTHALAALRVFRIARSIRVLRAFEAFSHIENLKRIVNTLLKSLPKMLYVVLLLMVLFYVYAVLGTFLFSPYDPNHFGNLGLSFITLFESMAGNWPSYMDNLISVLSTTPHSIIEPPIIAPIYFISFYFIAGLIILNLFIGIIVAELSDAQKESDNREMKKLLKGVGSGSHGKNIHGLIAKFNKDLENISEDYHHLKKELSSYLKNI